DAVARALWTNIGITEMEPEFPRTFLCERHRHRHRIVARRGLLHVADNVIIIHLRKTQIARLQQSRICSANAIKLRDIAADIARPVPVSRLELIFLGIEIFFLSGYRLVLEKLESVVDAVVSGKRCSQRKARLEDPLLAAL